MPAMALLDNDGVYGAPRFHLAAQKTKVKAHIGAEITVQSPKSKVQSLKSKNNLSPTDVGRWSLDVERKRRRATQDTFMLPLLARNRAGYQNLCRLITLMKMRVPKHAKPGECAVSLDELAEYSDGLVCVTGDGDGPIANEINHRKHREAERITERLIGIFGRDNVYAEL